MQTEVNTISYKKCWNGNSLPKLVKNILTNFNLFLSGSSLVHDRYFPEEVWVNRDYDIWGSKEEINDTINYVKTMNPNVSCEYIFAGELFMNYSHVRSIVNIKIDDLKLQFLEFATNKTINDIVNNIDFTFLKLYFHKGEIYYFVNEENIVNRVGDICIKNNISASIPKNSKLETRIQKYRFRGFSFNNICKCCFQCLSPNINHYIGCIRNKLANFHMQAVIKFSLEYPNNKLFIAILSTFIRTYNPEDFIKLYYFYSEKGIKINIHEENDYLFELACKNGMATICKFLYSISLDKDEKCTINIVTNYHSIFKYVTSRHFIETSKFLCKIYPEYSIKVVDDKIVKAEIETIFDFYTRTKDKKKVIERLSNNFTEYHKETMELCPICKSSDAEVTSSCQHHFCLTCLTLWLKNNNRECPYCQTEFN